MSSSRSLRMELDHAIAEQTVYGASTLLWRSASSHPDTKTQPAPPEGSLPYDDERLYFEQYFERQDDVSYRNLSVTPPPFRFVAKSHPVTCVRKTRRSQKFGRNQRQPIPSASLPEQQRANKRRRLQKHIAASRLPAKTQHCRITRSNKPRSFKFCSLGDGQHK